MQNHAFPWGIYIGDFINEHAEEHATRLPVLLPADTGGFCVVYDEESEAIANNLMENVALSVAQVLPAQAIEFHVFDFGHKKRFPYLAMLQTAKLYHIALNSDAAARAFAGLEAISQRRYQELLTPQRPTLSAYNRHSNYPEPYHFLLIHLEYYPDDFTGYLRLKSFCEAAADAGIYTILFTPLQRENQENSSNREKCLEYLMQRFPQLTIQHKQVHLHKDLFAYPELAQWYDFVFPGHNREAIAQHIIDALQQDDPAASRRDFLSVPIAVSLDGRHPVHFNLGDRSQNYHAFITGQTGSGKTVLLNNLIVGIARQYTADQVRLYLMDYKQGVEFSVFKDHPNCEKLFLDETDFSLAADMIGDFAETINLRSTLLKKAPGYTSIEEYNRAFPDTPLPYLVLIIDEVQRLFSGNYQQKDYFIKTMDFVLREGRSYGLHIILATQTLAGSGVDKNLMSQMQLRLSFKLGRQADAETIFDFHNDAPLHLDSSRFELIVNTGSGRKEANTICRANPPVDIPAELERIRASRSRSQSIRPQIFEGIHAGAGRTAQAAENVQAAGRRGQEESPEDDGLPPRHKNLYAGDAERAMLDELRKKGIRPRPAGEAS